MRSRIDELMNLVSKSGRSTNWSVEHMRTVTTHGILCREEYCATIFHRHSCRIEVQFLDESLEKIVDDVNRYIKDKHIDWVLDESIGEPF